MPFYGYHGSKCTEDKDAIQKYLSTDRKWETYLQGQSLYYVKMPQIKKLKKKVHLDIRKKWKISVPPFQSNFVVEGTHIFTRI
jgi:hypothetical protein